jgi:hypothetical protein
MQPRHPRFQASRKTCAGDQNAAAARRNARIFNYRGFWEYLVVPQGAGGRGEVDGDLVDRGLLGDGRNHSLETRARTGDVGSWTFSLFGWSSSSSRWCTMSRMPRRAQRRAGGRRGGRGWLDCLAGVARARAEFAVDDEVLNLGHGAPRNYVRDVRLDERKLIEGRGRAGEVLPRRQVRRSSTEATAKARSIHAVLGLSGDVVWGKRERGERASNGA